MFQPMVIPARSAASIAEELRGDFLSRAVELRRRRRFPRRWGWSLSRWRRSPVTRFHSWKETYEMENEIIANEESDQEHIFETGAHLGGCA